ncbi:zinc finger MYM-type 1-like [Paramuricea clavata]|uniref:Zinc finger MYM-type 1-like n=1 Tax=Paramuricea clavata TaxID=317549 RepID=A0A7D9JZ02_PARCT|nr:zinc finger MYM-type 1-like [Paramuricea clavata]
MRQDLITFSHNGEKAFLLGEFSDWKKCQEKLKKHSQSKFHAEATEKVLLFDDSRSDIGAKLVGELKNPQETRRQMLLKQLSSIRYLARQAQSLQGKTDIESNLHQLLKLRAEDVPELLEWIDNGRYLSHDIINELINMMGNAVLRSIVTDLRKESQLFSLIADESRDISNKEQLTCVLRWISTTNLSVHEDFLGMYKLKKTDAETITTSLKDILLRCNLTIDDCRWQTYDGAANMAGSRSGVAARISLENPRALYIHCGNHSLDLALHDCVKESGIISDTLKFVQDLAVFIRSSPTRMAQYQHIAEEINDNGMQVENPHLLCPTRWTVRTKAISAVLHNYEALYSTLLSIAKESSKSTVRDTASGMASQLKKFSTYFGLSFAQNVFSVCEQVASTLQKPSITAQTTVTCVTSLKTNLQRQRDDFHLFYDQVVTSSKAINFVDDPKLSRAKQLPRRFQHGDGEQHHFQSAKEFHRAQCVEALDACMAALQERFDQEIYSVLMNIETVLINAANGHTFELNDAVKRLYEEDLDFDQLKAELKLLEGIISQRLPEVKKVTSIDTITSIFSTEETDSSQIVMAMSNVVRLLQIYLLAPMSAASGERSFSSQRLVKTYLRSTMTAARYNNLIVMHVNKARTDELDLSLIAKDFVLKNERRVRFFGKFY